MAITLYRSNSMTEISLNVPHQPVSDLREPAIEISHAVTDGACEISQIGVQVGVSAAGHPEIASVTVGAMKAAQPVLKEGSERSIDTGFYDGSIERTHRIFNNCVIQ